MVYSAKVESINKEIMTAIEFNHLIVNNQGLLRGYANHLTKTREDAEDLLQDTMVKALNNKDKFLNYPKNIKGWLYTIMKNIFINDYRKKSKRKIVHDYTKETAIINTGNEMENVTPETKYLSNEIRNQLDALKDKHKMPLQMFISGYKYHEIADKMDMNLGTIKSRIYFARKILSESMD